VCLEKKITQLYIFKTIQRNNKIKCFSFLSLHLWKLDETSSRRACLCSRRVYLSVAVEVSSVLVAVLATSTRITRNNPRRDMKVYRLSSVGTDSVKSTSHWSSTPDVTGLVENLYVSDITVECLVLKPCILEISGSSLKMETSYPGRPSLLISSFMSGEFHNSMTWLKSSYDHLLPHIFNWLFTNHPIILSYVVWAIERVVKRKLSAENLYTFHFTEYNISVIAVNPK
jgi:hypothetical protein